MWPFLERADQLLAVSAFLDTRTVARLAASSDNVILLSRQESLDKIGSGASLPSTRLFTLQRSAEAELGDDVSPPVQLLNEASDTPEGLHAKTFIADVGARAVVITGSANATTAGFSGNVEFDVVMEGPREECGVAATWAGSGSEAPGLSRLCAPYTPGSLSEEQADVAAKEWEIDQFHAQVAALPLRMQVESVNEGRYALSLIPVKLISPGQTSIWPLSLPRQGFEQRLDAVPRWAPIGLASVSPFLVVETTSRQGSVQAKRTTVLKAALIDDPPERTKDALHELLSNQRDVLRYLVFLLGDPAYDEWFGTGDGRGQRWAFDPSIGFTSELALFEPLVKAAARGDDALERVASLVDELRGMERLEQLLPDGFDDLWSAVWAAYQKSGR